MAGRLKYKAQGKVGSYSQRFHHFLNPSHHTSFQHFTSYLHSHLVSPTRCTAGGWEEGGERGHLVCPVKGVDALWGSSCQPLYRGPHHTSHIVSSCMSASWIRPPSPWHSAQGPAGKQKAWKSSVMETNEKGKNTGRGRCCACWEGSHLFPVQVVKHEAETRKKAFGPLLRKENLQENFVRWLKVNFYPIKLFFGRFHLFKMKQMRAHGYIIK